MPWFDVDADLKLFYTDEGSGPGVLLLHGWTCDGSDWAWLATDLAVDHRVVVVDHRGHGRSSVVDGPYGAKPMAADAAALLRHLGMEDVVAVGHSMGTLVACALAVEAPSLIRALALVDPVYGQSDELVGASAAAVRAAPIPTATAIFTQFYVEGTPSWLPTWHRRRIEGTAERVVAEALAALYEGPDGIGRAAVGGEYLQRITCPSLAVYGGARPQDMEWDRAQPHGPNDVIQMWAEAGHFLHQEQPERFAELLRTWLSTLPSDARAERA
jgi:pimeloyl-ACP methyl ester carboxylesterase